MTASILGNFRPGSDNMFLWRQRDEHAARAGRLAAEKEEAVAEKGWAALTKLRPLVS
jgi:hypothetical protein